MRAQGRRHRSHEEDEESAFVSMTDMTVGFLFVVMILLAFVASEFREHADRRPGRLRSIAAKIRRYSTGPGSFRGRDGPAGRRD